MLYIALVSFSGAISMHKGEVGEIPASLVDDLLKAGYIAPYAPTNGGKEEVPEKKTKRKGKGNEN